MGGRGVPAVRRGGVLGRPAAGGAARRGGQPVAERQPQAAYWFAVRGRPVLAGRCPPGRRPAGRRVDASGRDTAADQDRDRSGRTGRGQGETR